MENEGLTPTQEARLLKASKLTVAQIQEAERIIQAVSGLTPSEETVLSLANTLAINYMSVLRATKQ